MQLLESARNVMTHGGWVVWAIMILSTLAWLLIAWEWLRLREHRAGGWHWFDNAIEQLNAGRPVQMSEADPAHRNLIGRLFMAGLVKNKHSRRDFHAQMMPLVTSDAVELHRPLRVIGVLAALMPLLGLLGTVLGMVTTFAAITAGQSAQVDALAGGISQALITTQAGLVVAVPIVLAHGYLASQVRQYVETATVMVRKIETIVCYD